ncbi:electron transport complex subunit RsxC [Simiduia aestuariiviva]|uniref:Ion-translocating oxidoreductase complex subunit C n=1 Tax=Simiduia aestuariiviva TaxID=1510459 RepID=A0A839UP99_9GAMM|nr:electron transport complex subunit RsxC [Simiduia aestuariiviva]MBB3167586.1 electron transport complex protein RnfC [Simiduia aestuariiviva]
MTQIWNIPGGIHPPENKQQSLRAPLGHIDLPAELVLPLNQHLGAPAEPVVAVGDNVKTGQVIAQPGGQFSAAVHASSSGRVIAIEDRPLPHPSGFAGPCIVIAPDGLDTWINLEPCPDYRAQEPVELVQKIRLAGIAGMGGAGFPTAIKLAPKANQPIDTLILNGTECEPYITADDRLMRDRPEQVIEGARLMAYLLGEPDRVVIGIEDNKPEAIAALRAAAEGSPIEIAGFPTKYPSGGEKQLITILTGREVPAGKIPADIGIVVQNVGTAVAAWRAVVRGEPLISRITTVVGEALDVQRNVEVRLGTPVAHVLAAHGFQAAKASRIVLGGPMMGYAIETGDVPVVKTTNCILAPSQQELPAPPPAQACIRCGMCSEACPASLLPQQLYWYARAQDHEKLEAYNLFDCIECGACAYVCPSSIPLVHYYRAAKGDIRQAQVDKEKADRSRERFAFRQERIARQEAEKEAKRAERAKAAAAAKAKMAEKKSNAGTASDPVATAIAKAKAQQASAQQSPVEQRAKLERQLSAAQGRLALAQEKLSQAETEEQAEKCRAAVKTAEIKLTDVQQKLANAKDAPKDDPVAAAIERAKAKLTMSPLEKLNATIATLSERLQKAEAKLAQAQTEQSAHVEALQLGVDKLRAKLNEAQEELASHSPTTADERAPDDAASAAIERAKAKAAARAAMSDTDKLREQVSSLEVRLDKARQKLADAEAEGSPHVDALRTAADKLANKLADTQSRLENA